MKLEGVLRAVGLRKKVVESYKQVFDKDNLSGQLVLGDLLKGFKFFSKSYVEKDPYATAFNEGQRSVLLYIQNMIHFDIEQLHKAVSFYEKESSNGKFDTNFDN